jgi:predicted metallopeptidase
MFIYTALVQRAMEDMVRTVPALRYIQPRRVTIVAGPRVCRTRNGNLAQCFALRENEGEDVGYWYNPRSRRVVRVTPWTRRENSRVVLHGVEMPYLIMLRLPRLLQHQPLETFIHELIHIGPRFDGRMRRLRHGRRFEDIVRHCAQDWRRDGDPELVGALESDYATLTSRWGTLVAESFGPPFVTPRLTPLENPPPIASYPDFQRRRLIYDPATVEVVEAKWTPEDVPAQLTEKDLVYRVYTPESASRISAAAVHASCRLLPASARQEAANHRVQE